MKCIHRILIINCFWLFVKVLEAQHECPKFPGMKDFNMEKFQGLWFSNINNIDQSTFCQVDNLTSLSPSVVRRTQSLVYNDKVASFSINNMILDEENPATFTWEHLSIQTGFKWFTVMDTDYINYAATITCRRARDSVYENSATILSRNYTLDPASWEKGRTALSPYFDLQKAPLRKQRACEKEYAVKDMLIVGTLTDISEDKTIGETSTYLNAVLEAFKRSPSLLNPNQL